MNTALMYVYLQILYNKVKSVILKINSEKETSQFIVCSDSLFSIFCVFYDQKYRPWQGKKERV